MMVGEVDVGIIALGILVVCVAPFVFFITASLTGVDDLALQGIMLLVIGLFALCLNHPFQFLAPIALGVSVYVIAETADWVRMYLQRRRERSGG